MSSATGLSDSSHLLRIDPSVGINMLLLRSVLVLVGESRRAILLDLTSRAPLEWLLAGLRAEGVLAQSDRKAPPFLTRGARVCFSMRVGSDRGDGGGRGWAEGQAAMSHTGSGSGRGGGLLGEREAVFVQLSQRNHHRSWKPGHVQEVLQVTGVKVKGSSSVGALVTNRNLC